MSKFVFTVIITITSICLCQVADGNNEGKTYNVFGKLKSGFQLAGKLLGLDQASGVANLVSEAFGKTTNNKKGDNGSAEGNNIFSGFLRILGFDSKKVGAIAVNAIIFVAQLISSSLSLTKPSQLTTARQIKNGTPFDWMMNNSHVKHMLSSTKDKDLPNHIIMYIKERSLDEETDCVQLLVCKSAPFVWGMQKALKERGKGNLKGSDVLFAYLPTREEVADHGDKCEKKHPFCFIHI